LLRKPQRIQTIEDDRESAIHVLTWLALRYTKHDDLEHLNDHLTIYDEVDHRQSESIATGGRAKGDNFSSEVFPTFASDPLDRLLTEVREIFAFRYQRKKHSPGEIQQAMDFMAFMASGRPFDSSKVHLVGAYFYGSGMESLKKPNWLIEVFNKHLDSDDWPLDDKAVANDITPGTSSALKRKSTQAKLVERPLGSNSK
jgi:hypothetical protein